MILSISHVGVPPISFLNLSSCLFIFGAVGILQTFLANQNLPFVILRQRHTPRENIDFHHICASAVLIASCIPGIVLAYSFYSGISEPSILGPILAVIILTLIYGLVGYLMHFAMMVLNPEGHANQALEASWLQEHHYLLRRMFLFTLGIVAFAFPIILMTFDLIDLGIQNFHYDVLLEQVFNAAQGWQLHFFHYSRLPLWLLLISLFYMLIFWGRNRLGYASKNNPWILSNLALVFGAICTFLPIIDLINHVEEPFVFMYPIGPIFALSLSWGLSMWWSRKVRTKKLPRYKVKTEFLSPLLWTRIYQALCFIIILTALSIGDFGAIKKPFLSVTVLCLFGIYSLSRQRKLESMVDRRTHQLELANKRNESLLHNVLPVSIAERLKEEEEQVIADDHSQVSILFADIAGYGHVIRDELGRVGQTT